jgi:hypothetical protein
MKSVLGPIFLYGVISSSAVKLLCHSERVKRVEESLVLSMILEILRLRSG